MVYINTIYCCELPVFKIKAGNSRHWFSRIFSVENWYFATLITWTEPSFWGHKESGRGLRELHSDRYPPNQKPGRVVIISIWMLFGWTTNNMNIGHFVDIIIQPAWSNNYCAIGTNYFVVKRKVFAPLPHSPIIIQSTYCNIVLNPSIDGF